MGSSATEGAESVTRSVSEPELVHDPRPGPSHSRYVTLGPLGAGGMGEVTQAYDRRLQREVALKRVKSSALGPRAEARLVREAQAMAQLSHPNVVAVHDVDVDADTVTVVMELVSGKTLAQWLAAGPPWRDVVRTFVAAGRGLEAAHRAGLVHRDFKPSNVIVSDDGRARVLDFGLATAARTARTQSAEPDPPGSDGTPSLTAAGSTMGTPRYMAPEQHFGQATDARTDQYAFCVALWQALAGEPPFRGEGMAEAKRAGPPSWPRARSVPQAIVAAITRGLAPCADDRWSSMSPLLAALSSGSTTIRRRIAWLGTGGSVLAVGAMVVAAEPDQRCTGASTRLDEAWNDGRRQSVEHALRSTQAPFASVTWASIEPRLDDYARAWVAQHTEACQATTIRGEQSSAVLDLRMACLERAHTSLAMAVEVLGAADARVAENAPQIVDGLPQLGQCEDVDALAAEVPPPQDPETAAAVEAGEARLSWAATLVRASDYEAALTILEPLAVEAEQLGYPPLLARVQLARGNALFRLARSSDALEAQREALDLAFEHGPRQIAARAAIGLAWTLSKNLDRHDSAAWMARVAIGIATGLDDDLLLATALDARAGVLFGRAQYRQAEATVRQSLALRIDALGPEHHEVWDAHKMLGSILHDSGQFEAAIAEHRRALELAQASVGPEHPSVAMIHNNLAISHNAKGEYDEALAEYRIAETILEAVYGPNHVEVSFPIDNSGNTLRAMGRDEDSLHAHRRALEIRREVLPETHHLLASSYGNVGITLHAMERFEEAESYVRRAMDAWARSETPNHPSAGLAHLNLGAVLASLDRHDEASAEYLRAIELWKQSLPEEHVYVSTAYENLGRQQHRAGRHEQARAYLEKAVAMGASTSAPVPQAKRMFDLAKVLWEFESEHPRALEVAERARAIYVGNERPQQAAEIADWLAARR